MMGGAEAEQTQSKQRDADSPTESLGASRAPGVCGEAAGVPWCPREPQGLVAAMLSGSRLSRAGGGRYGLASCRGSYVAMAAAPGTCARTRVPPSLRARGQLPRTAQLNAFKSCAGHVAVTSSRLPDAGAAAGTAHGVCGVNPTCAHACTLTPPPQTRTHI